MLEVELDDVVVVPLDPVDVLVPVEPVPIEVVLALLCEEPPLVPDRLQPGSTITEIVATIIADEMARLTTACLYLSINTLYPCGLFCKMCTVYLSTCAISYLNRSVMKTRQKMP